MHGFIFPDDRQVRRTSVKKLDDLRSPLGFLLGKTRLEKELDGLSLAPDIAPLTPGNTVLRGVPKGYGGSDQSKLSWKLHRITALPASNLKRRTSR